MRRFAAVLAAMSLWGCGPELNPPTPPPSSQELASGGVYVAYNLGCEQGCDQIRRGDRILAVDGRPVRSGAEVDALNLARGTPVTLKIARRDGGAPVDVTIVATPRDNMPPLKGAPPLWTVGADALDRAPEWARLRMFSHAIPAMRLYRGEEPRGFINGRELYGRGAVILVWELDWTLSKAREAWALLPVLYAQLQARDAELQQAGVDTYIVFASTEESRGLRPVDGEVARSTPGPEGGVRWAVPVDKREEIRSKVPPEQRGALMPLFQLESGTEDPNTLGLEYSAADLREQLFDRVYGPVMLVIDRRGIVRMHVRDFPLGATETVDYIINFALHELADVPETAVADRR